MGAGFEREIKLRFEDAAAARMTIVAAGGGLKRARRLQSDRVYDAPDARLRNAGSVLRLRVEESRAVLTFKGPLQPSSMKVREEIETEVFDGATLDLVLERLGFRVMFRYEKFREEYSLAGCLAALDETPVGTFVELEGGEGAIRDATALLGRTPADFILESYRTLYLQQCARDGVPCKDMIFDEAART